MRVLFNLNVDCGDDEAQSIIDQGIEMEIDIRPMEGDMLNLYDLLPEGHPVLENGYVHDTLMDLDDSIVTTTKLNKDSNGFFIEVGLE